LLVICSTLADVLDAGEGNFRPSYCRESSIDSISLYSM
jgi:hypothetical protein